MSSESFFEFLIKEYTIILVTDTSEFNDVKKIREGVYSRKYAKPTPYLESLGVIEDNDDKQSFVYLLKHNDTGKYVGTVRVFFLNHNTLLKKLTMQVSVQEEYVSEKLKDLPVMEISRLALLSKLPARHEYSDLRLRTALAYCLMVATRITLMLYPPYFVFSIMEPTLHRILKRQQVNFEKISDPVDSYGIPRIPYVINSIKLLQDTEGSMGALTRHYLKEMCENSEKLWQFVDNNPYLDRDDIQLDRICQLFKEHGDDVDVSLLLGEETP